MKDAVVNRSDANNELLGACAAFVELLLLFYDGAPWTPEAQRKWDELQKPIVRLVGPGPGRLYLVEATTRGLADMGRALLAQLNARRI